MESIVVGNHQQVDEEDQQSGGAGDKSLLLQPAPDMVAALAAVAAAAAATVACRGAMVAPDPEPHMSSQFYTFNRASHALMVNCLMARRHPSSDEVRSVATPAVLASWRGVWKDRLEDTAYLTGWRRIQDKLQAHVDELGNEVLYFKNNPYQLVPFIEQWSEIVQEFHVSPEMKHLGHKETLDRIREVWTVGAKFYGVPESYVKVCIATCTVCNATSAAAEQHQQLLLQSTGNASSGDANTNEAGQQPRRRRFEYTESFEVAAKDVPQRLQHLAAKYKVVLCIRQKYIRYKPFLAEVKDYCCHRGGEPTGRKPGVLKRKRYMSKRCGCSFRIRAIVPITNYDEKEKTFSYQEEGLATFKLYAVHSGHEPGPHEGSARIIHRFVDPSSLSEEMEAVSEKEEEETRQAVLRQLHELQMELGDVEQRLETAPVEVLNSLCVDLSETIQKLRTIDKSSAMDNSREELELHETWIDKAQGTSEQNHLQQHLQQPKNFDRSCARCGLKAHDGSSSLCKSCDLVASHEVSLDSSRDGALVVVGNYCSADTDKWYEGMACGLDTTHSVEFLGHAMA